MRSGLLGKVAGAETLLIRPLAPSDRRRYLEAFDRLSPASRYRRFFTPHDRLSEAEVRYFTEVDHHDHEALVAVDPAIGNLVGVARYVRSTADPSVAELAVAVIDDWQGCGVGSRLTGALADRAREEGITGFSALVLADNELMLSLLGELGRVHVLHREEGTVELTVDLPERGLGHVRRLLAAVGRGEIEPLAHPRRGAGGTPPSE